jgi:predicted O-methyltransferase YrrM
VGNDNYPDTVAVNQPNRRTVELIAELRPKMVAEIGIYRGHTSREIVKHLPDGGQLHLYDFDDTVRTVADQLAADGYGDRVVRHGNSSKTLDSYNWSLMRTLEQHPQPIYDYVFIDGAHTWHHDALAFLLVDRLLKPGGHVDFDDYGWTLRGSPSLNPEAFPKTADWYTDEQIDTKQVELVVELLVRRDRRYVEVVRDKVFQKKPSRWRQWVSRAGRPAPA